MISVLLVEDDLRLADALSGALRSHGYQVRHVSTGAQAIAADPVDVVLLDLGLPDGDGLDVCQALRERFDMADAAILVVTARGQERQRVAGLRRGADDYIVKPLAMEELLARMEAVLRRTRGTRAAVLTGGPVRLDLAAREATFAGAIMALTRKEFDLLVALVREAGAVLSHERLMLTVWQTAWQGNRRTLEVHVGTLRSKLGNPDLIETVRGVGYRFAADASAEGSGGAGPASEPGAAPAGRLTAHDGAPGASRECSPITPDASGESSPGARRARTSSAPGEPIE